MRAKSKKILDVEKWVDNYIKKNKFPPTYRVLANRFGISRTAAWSRCAKFRSKMEKPPKKLDPVKFTRVKLSLLIPNEKFESFSILLSKINKLLLK